MEIPGLIRISGGSSSDLRNLPPSPQFSQRASNADQAAMANRPDYPPPGQQRRHDDAGKIRQAQQDRQDPPGDRKARTGLAIRTRELVKLHDRSTRTT
jgi:hypothetical protein